MAVNKDAPAAGPPSSEPFLDGARRRDTRRHNLRPAQTRKLAVADNIIRNVGHFFVQDPGPENPDPEAPPATQFVLNPDLHPGSRPLTIAPLELVSWEFVGVHVYAFRGVPKTGRPVWFRGLTIAEDLGEGAEPRYTFRQFIDWREVLLQLGIAPESVRPLVGNEDLERLARVE